MKKLILLSVLTFSFVSCNREDDCGCVTPPGADERLRVSLVNENGENLLLPDTFGYIAEDKLTFYLITGGSTLNLTQTERNKTIIDEYTSEADGSIIKNISLQFGWYMKNNNGTKEGNYIIDYNGLYPNDTIFAKYKVTPWEESDRLLEVKLNGILQQTDSIAYLEKGFTIIK